MCDEEIQRKVERLDRQFQAIMEGLGWALQPHQFREVAKRVERADQEASGDDGERDQRR